MTTFPLKDLIVVNTRPLFNPGQQQLSQKITALGGRVITLPLQQISPIPADQWLPSLPSWSQISYCIFVSIPAVEFFFQTLLQQHIAWPTSLAAIAVGPATANTLHKYHIQNILVAPENNSESFRDLAILQTQTPHRIVWIKGPHGRPVIGEILTDYHLKFIELNIYHSKNVHYTPENLHALWQAPQQTIILISSLKALLHLHAQIPTKHHRTFQKLTLLVFSQRIKNEAKKILQNPIFVTKHDTIIEDLISFQHQR